MPCSESWLKLRLGLGLLFFGKRKTKCSRFALPSRGVWIFVTSFLHHILITTFRNLLESTIGGLEEREADGSWWDEKTRGQNKTQHGTRKEEIIISPNPFLPEEVHRTQVSKDNPFFKKNFLFLLEPWLNFCELALAPLQRYKLGWAGLASHRHTTSRY